MKTLKELFEALIFAIMITIYLILLFAFPLPIIFISIILYASGIVQFN